MSALDSCSGNKGMKGKGDRKGTNLGSLVCRDIVLFSVLAKSFSCEFLVEVRDVVGGDTYSVCRQHDC